MTRMTSKKVYKEIIEDGTTYTQSTKIFLMLKLELVPLTISQICAYTGFEKSAVSGRLHALKKEGKVYEHPLVKCPITGRLVTPVSAYEPISQQTAIFTDEELRGIK